MATRSGDLDPEVMLHLLRSGYDADQLEDLLGRRSGLLGLRRIGRCERGAGDRGARRSARAACFEKGTPRSLQGSQWGVIGSLFALRSILALLAAQMAESDIRPAHCPQPMAA
jgi:hypothetical protein